LDDSESNVDPMLSLHVKRTARAKKEGLNRTPTKRSNILQMLM
jgi:hypothetical protein